MRVLIQRIFETKKVKAEENRVSLDILIDEVGRLAIVVDRSKRIISRFEKMVHGTALSSHDDLFSQLIVARRLVNTLEERLEIILTDVKAKKKKAFIEAQRQLEQPIAVENSLFGDNSQQSLGIKACSQMLEDIFAELQQNLQNSLPMTYILPNPNPYIAHCHNA